MELHDFYIGKAFDAWTYFGAHPDEKGWMFRVYAPNALSVSLKLLLDEEVILPMEKEGTSGVWQVKTDQAKEGDAYLYRIVGQNGQQVDHTDPYAFSSLVRPEYASVITDLTFDFHDEDWIKNRKIGYNDPINIYEMHLGSWRRKEDGGFYTYEELADQLIGYLKEGAYTHVEFLPVTEHPVDESWGYQVSGFYSATSRYGTPQQLAGLIDRLHQEGIGVLMDFVPVHFALDDYALGMFDGTALYEYPSEDTGHSEWGSRNFNYYRGEVRSFLQSSADFWIQKYHFDGLRMDAISNALYWQGNANRGLNEGAVEFIQEMNKGLSSRYPNVMKIAEDSTSYLKVTAPVQYQGLGYDYKWDMGWMNDTLDFFKSDSAFRGQEIGKLTWTMQYFYNELFMLPLSHDEVVHGKKTILDKMPGDYEDKFDQARLLYLYMFASPGKKLNFMGYEFGHFAEWSEARQLDWNLLEYPAHLNLYHYINALNRLYLNTPAMYEQDYNPECFDYVRTNRSEVLCFERRGNTDHIVALFNFGKNAYGHPAEETGEEADREEPAKEDDLILSFTHPVKLEKIFSSKEEVSEDTLESDRTGTPVQYPHPGNEFRVKARLDGFTGILYKETILKEKKVSKITKPEVVKKNAVTSAETSSTKETRGPKA